MWSTIKRLLETIYETIRYGDNTAYVPADKELSIKIIELETAISDEDDDRLNQIDGILNEMLSLVKKRTLEVQNIKRGGL